MTSVKVWPFVPVVLDQTFAHWRVMGLGCVQDQFSDSVEVSKKVTKLLKRPQAVTRELWQTNSRLVSL